MDENNLTSGTESGAVTETGADSGGGTETALDETGSGGGGDGAEEIESENAGNDTENAENETGDAAESSIDETDSGGNGTEAETINADSGGEADKVLLVYIGPSLTYEKLRTSQILSGTEQEIADFMAPITEKYPEAAHLLATPEELPEAMRKVGSKNSILHKYYQDMLARSRDIRKG